MTYRRVPWAVSPYSACSLFLVLTVLPFFFASDNFLFAIRRVVRWEEHLLLMIPLALITVAAVRMGYERTIVRADPSGETGRRVLSRKNAFTTMLVQFAFWGCIVVNIVAGTYTFFIYLQGGFLRAREFFDIPGVGVALRMYIPALPLMVGFSSGRLSKVLLAAVVVLGVFVVMRSVAISERSALVEYLVVISLLYQIRTGNNVTRYVLAALPVIAVYMALAMKDRLLTQGLAFSDSGILSNVAFELNNIFVYYADTVNKLYSGIIDGNTSSVFYFLDPLGKIIGSGDSNAVSVSNKQWLIRLDNMGITNTGLSNPGGLYQDFSDFSYSFIIVLFAKFYVFGILGRMFVLGRAMGMALYPLCFVATIEYPRFNYFGNGYGFILLLFCILIGYSCSGLVLSWRGARRR